MSDSSSFDGIPASGPDFYAELERANTREWWLAHKEDYERDIRAPMTALVAALAPEFGEPHVFRPHRDVRFSHDASPYKTHQGAYCADPRGGYYYAHLDADGFFAGAGLYRMARDQLARYRRAVDEDLPGDRLAAILADLRAAGYEVMGDRLATRPRGVAADHPRLDLLRYRSLSARRDWGTPDWLATPTALGHVRHCWEGVRPLVDWLGTHVGPSQEPRRR